MKETQHGNAEEEPGAPDFIVGVGASAGGLEALELLFDPMPEHTGMGFVVVLHLKPDHKAMTAELLGRHTRLRVKEAEDDERVLPDHVYVIPPGYELQIFRGRLQLIEPSVRALLRTPIDTFLHSLAVDQQERAVGVILSGMGSDGSMGLRELKSLLGMVMVQEPSTARSTGMPDRAIQTGLADYVLPPGEMFRALRTYADAWRRGPSVQDVPLPDERRQSLSKIVMMLRSETGHDFSGYKSSTLVRRIDRRQKLHRLPDMEDYVRFLHHNKHELRVLFKEMLIGVTSFFRDPEGFHALQEALRQSLLTRSSDDGFRVWVVGCSTGEEAYSVAILLRECLEERHEHLSVQVFATDLDPDAIEQARSGRFPAGIERDVSAERRRRFFFPDDNEYVVKKEVREMVVFAEQDAIKDPPFTKLDLICCRNVLIYLEAALQHRLLPLFHYSLRGDGLLFIGTAESVGPFHTHFEPVNKKWKIFRRRAGSPPMSKIDFPLAEKAGALHPPARRDPRNREPNVADPMTKALLKLFAPPSVLVNKQGEILYTHGRTGKYLEPPVGQANWNIMEMAREGLKLDLTTAIRHAASSNEDTLRERVRVRTNGDYRLVDVHVCPLESSEATSDLLLVVFEDVEEPAEDSALSEGGHTDDPRTNTLEQELQRTKENLQTVIEELESSNEELKSTNEEFQSTNEELQSTNEELESSREELQSLNEELITVNTELQNKVEDADRAFEEMKNFLDALEIPTLFLDRDMRVQRFSAQASRIVRLIETDIGRPILDLVFHLRNERQEALVEEARRVLASLREERHEVQTRDGHWFQMRIMPYRSPDNVIEGVVVVFLDIQDQKTAHSELLEARQGQVHIDAVLGAVREPVLVLDAELRVLSSNQRFYQAFGVGPEDTLGKSVYAIGGRQWDAPALHELLEVTLPAKVSCEAIPFEHTFPRLGTRRLMLNARRISGEGAAGMILLAIDDVTDTNGQEG